MLSHDVIQIHPGEKLIKVMDVGKPEARLTLLFSTRKTSFQET